MGKKLDLSKSVYDLVQEYPELVDIMVELGFKDITKPMALNTMGRVMTIPKGAVIKGLDIPTVLAKLGENGFELAGQMPRNPFKKSTENAKAPTTESPSISEENTTDRTSQIKSYIERLTKGEDLESVRADFVENFAEVDPLEIVKAEQALIDGGTPIAEVQSLCDIHSALFHGATREEQIENAERAVEEAKKNAEDNHSLQTLLDQKSAEGRKKKEDAKSEMVKLSYTVNHPVYVFAKENNAIEAQIKVVREKLQEVLSANEADRESLDQELLQELKKFRQVAIHYAKKGDLLYPLLSSRYEVVGPSAVMWGVDDEIRDEVRLLASFVGTGDWHESIDKVLTRAEEMIYKERNILLPICVDHFTEEEWKWISRDLQDYEPCLTERFPLWDEAESLKRPTPAIEGDEVRFPVGHMNPAQLSAMLNTIPLEITFIDDKDVNRYFNRTSEMKAFKRPDAAIDREVYFCHPPKIDPMVRGIIDDFREGRRDVVDVWMNKNERPYLVRYMAVRDDAGVFQGTMEVVQDMSFAEKHFTR